MNKSKIGLITIFSMMLVTPLLFQKSSLAINALEHNISRRATSSLYDNNHLIAAINLASRPFARNATLNTNLIEQMYRGKWVSGQWQSSDTYLGGLAGAVRRELSKDELVGGVSHLQKGKERLAQLKDIITKGKFGSEVLESSDMDIVRALHDDLLSALQTKKQ